MRRGVTLLELMLVLTLLALVAGVSALAWSSGPEPEGALVVRALTAARAEAIHAGHAVVWRRRGAAVRFEPDGSASAARLTIGGDTVVVDPVTGSAHVSH